MRKVETAEEEEGEEEQEEGKGKKRRKNSGEENDKEDKEPEAGRAVLQGKTKVPSAVSPCSQALPRQCLRPCTPEPSDRKDSTRTQIVPFHGYEYNSQFYLWQFLPSLKSRFIQMLLNPFLEVPKSP